MQEASTVQCLARGSVISTASELAWECLLQGPDLMRLHGQLEQAIAEQASTSQQLAALQQEKLKLDEQLKILTADKASLKQQLSSTAGDIDMLQVSLSGAVHSWLQEISAATAAQSEAIEAV